MRRVRTPLTMLVAGLLVVACGAGIPRIAPAGDPGTTQPPPPAATEVIPSVAATPDTHAAAIDAFVEQVASGDMTYRVKYRGQVAASADVLPIAGSMDVAGDDFAASWTYDFDPEYPGAGLGKKKIQVRGVNDDGWIKRGSGAWRSIKGYDEADSYVPFKAVKTADDVKYLGAAKAGGTALHKISIPDALLMHPSTIPYQIQKEEVDQSTLELLIDDDGTPRSGTWHLVGKARVGDGIGQLQRIVYDLDLTFSKVGDTITIKRP